MKKLELYRYSSQKDSTLGLLFITDYETNEKEFLCFTLEDEKRDVKVYGETRIPKGEYEVVLREYGGHHERYKKKFSDFHRGMLEFLNVPSFTDILLHIGNDTSHSHGCLLCGFSIQENLIKEPFLGQSTAAYKYIYPKIVDLIDTQKHLSIKIINFEEN